MGVVIFYSLNTTTHCAKCPLLTKINIYLHQGGCVFSEVCLFACLTLGLCKAYESKFLETC